MCVCGYVVIWLLGFGSLKLEHHSAKIKIELKPNLDQQQQCFNW